MTQLGRETPAVPCTVFFEEYAWKSLLACVRESPAAPAAIPTLREPIRLVAGLGGFLGR